jgi:hypothetical protein
MVPDIASRASLSAVQTVSPDQDASAERWSVGGCGTPWASRQAGRRARIAFIVLLPRWACGPDYGGAPPPLWP